MTNKAMKHVTVVLLLSWAVLSMAQEKTYTELGGLNMGDHFEYPTVNHVLNVPGGRLDLAKYKGKLLILDFWGPGCSSCIAAFPKLDSLQKAHKDRICIIAVNKESRDSTIRYLASLKKIKAPSFPMITADTLLHRAFPHAYVPHHIWIDTLGSILYITKGINTNGKFIRDYFSGISLALSETRRINESGLTSSPLLDIVNEYQPRYSLLTKVIPGATILNRAPMYREGNNTGNRISLNSASILDLYLLAYSEGGKYNLGSPQRVEMDAGDRTKFIRPTVDSLYNEWYMQYCYNYDLRVPDTSVQHIYQFMQQDLGRYFGVKANIKWKSRKVYQVRIKDNVLFRSKVTEKPSPIGGQRDSIIFFRNATVHDVINHLQFLLKKRGFADIILDRTNYSRAFSMNLRKRFLTPFSMPVLNEELNNYGLALEYKRAKVPVLSLKPER